MDNETLPLRDRLMTELGRCAILSYGPSSMADAILPLIEAEREDAARRALEAATSMGDEYAAWHNQHDDGLSGFTQMALGASEVTDNIRAIDPAQFRSDRDGRG